MNIAIVTSSDAKYFPRLRGLLRSLQVFPQFDNLERCIMDVGLTPEQITQLPELGVKHIAAATWDLEFPNQPTTPLWFRAMTGRPHLPRYFPKYDILLWLDSDTMLLTSQPIELLLKVAISGQLAIVPEVDRAYDHCFHNKAGSTQYNRNLYARGWGQEVSDALGEFPMLNTGVFALRSDSPCWQLWSQHLHYALQNTTNTIVEQAALNLVIYSRKHPAHFLPAWCNWLGGNAFPLLDLATRNVHSALLPHEQIGILHAGIAKNALLPIPCSDGLFRHLPLTYEAIKIDPLPHGTPTPPQIMPNP